jgi:hypothetical protein
MRQFLIDFLKAVEADIPPPARCHHVLTYARYGSNDTGWEDKLALQINDAGDFKCFFLEDSDLLDIPKLIIEIKESLNSSDTGQLGVSIGQYVK